MHDVPHTSSGRGGPLAGSPSAPPSIVGTFKHLLCAKPLQGTRTQWRMTRDRHGFSLEQLADHRGVRKIQGGEWPREPSCQQAVLSEGQAV